jgi:aspartate 1-decarboxylase
MGRTMLRAKIHRATVTGADVDYVGSISLCPRLMAEADIREYEQVHVLDVDNGSRLVTYAILGQPGEVCLNGAAAHLVDVGHRVIVVTYTDLQDAELDAHRPRVVHVDTENRPVDEATAKALAGMRRYVTVPADPTVN